MKKILFILSLLFISNITFSQDVTEKLKDNISLEYSKFSNSIFINIYNTKGKKVPILDTVEYGKSSYIGVQIDKNYYNLKDSRFVDVTCTNEEDAFILDYNVSKKVLVSVRYELKENNILQISYTIKNIDKKIHTVTLKSIFDTIISERKNFAFSTDLKKKIDLEYIIYDFKRHKYIASTDKNIGMAFVLNDGVEKYINKVVIAAKSYLALDGFDNSYIEGRGFNTVYSYRNSSVGFFFNRVTLAQDKEKTYAQSIKVDVNDYSFVEDSLLDEEYYLEEENDTQDLIYNKPVQKSSKNSSISNPYSSDNKSLDTKNDFADKKTTEATTSKTANKTNNDLHETLDVSEAANAKNASLDEQNISSSENAPFTNLAQTESTNTQEEQNKLQQQKEQEKRILKQRALKIIERINAINPDGSNIERIEVYNLQQELNQIQQLLNN